MGAGCTKGGVYMAPTIQSRLNEILKDEDEQLASYKRPPPVKPNFSPTSQHRKELPFTLADPQMKASQDDPWISTDLSLEEKIEQMQAIQEAENEDRKLVESFSEYSFISLQEEPVPHGIPSSSSREFSDETLVRATSYVEEDWPKWDLLSELPNHARTRIAGYLTKDDVKAMKSVCKKWSKLEL